MLEEAGGYTWGDSHHPNLSETDGAYDGWYIYVNDKANGRVARVNLTYFETDAIVDVPNVQSVLTVTGGMADVLVGTGLTTPVLVVALLAWSVGPVLVASRRVRRRSL